MRIVNTTMNIKEYKEYLTIGETQAYLGSSRTFIYNLVNQGKLNQYHVNKRVYFRVEEIIDLFKKD